MRKFSRVLAVVLISLFGSWGVLGVYTNIGPTKAIEELKVGSTYKELIRLAGKPNYETNGTMWAEPGDKKSEKQIIEGCVRESWYENWPNIFPSKYSFCFNSSGILLHKYHWSSW